MNANSPHVFVAHDADGSLLLVEAPHEANSFWPRVVGKYPNTERGHELLDAEMSKRPKHIWM